MAGVDREGCEGNEGCLIDDLFTATGGSRRNPISPGLSLPRLPRTLSTCTSKNCRYYDSVICDHDWRPPRNTRNSHLGPEQRGGNRTVVPSKAREYKMKHTQFRRLTSVCESRAGLPRAPDIERCGDIRAIRCRRGGLQCLHCK
jgi:hypothetical protein